MGALRIDLEALADLRLVRYRRDTHTYATHALVAEYYRDSVEQQVSRKLHGWLYEFYKDGVFIATEEFPDTLEAMQPLFEAVFHGTQAGRHQEALYDVFWRRIRREQEAFSWRKLGAFSAELAVLSGFFELPWRQPVAGLTEAAKSFVLGEAGFALRALGQLADASQPIQMGLEAAIALENWRNASRAAGSLSQLHLTMGDLLQALAVAQQAIELADLSGREFLRLIWRANRAAALHQAGRLAEAQALFQEAEMLQKESQPTYPLLYSLQGFRYCNLLLDSRKFS